MSIKVPLAFLTMAERALISKKLRFDKKETSYNKFKPVSSIYAYEIEELESLNDMTVQQIFDKENNVVSEIDTSNGVNNFDPETVEQIGYIYLPFCWALKNISRAERPDRSKFEQINVKFVGNLRPLQIEVRSEALNLLNKYGSCVLSLYTGAGKTITSINISTRTKLKTMILCHRLVLIEQWKSSILKFCPDAKIQILKGTDKKAKDALDESNDFFIMNALNVAKKGHSYFDCIGTVIVDEVHTMATQCLSDAFNYINPRYLIGLSATPYRSDGMDALLDAYFGKKKIFRKLYHEHSVYKVTTTFVPEFQIGMNGKIDWNSLIESQTSELNRNELIVRIVRFFRDRNFLILSKRVNQVVWIVKRLETLGESVTSLVGLKKSCDFSSRILVATVQKAGVGFDHPKLDSLIIASDVEEYFIQYLGRIFRREDVQPIVFDILDQNPILAKHYRTRQKIYKDHGGVVEKFNYKNISVHFPNLTEKQFNDEFMSTELELSFK